MIDVIDVFCAQLTRDLFAIAKFLLVTWAPSRGCVAPLYAKLGTNISLSITEILSFYEIQYGRRPPSCICYGKSWGHTRMPIYSGYPPLKI